MMKDALYSLNLRTRNSAAPVSDCDGRVVKIVSPVKIRRSYWACDT